MSKDQRWFELITEACVIVISIPLAFGIDACWEERKDSHLSSEVVRSAMANILQ